MSENSIVPSSASSSARVSQRSAFLSYTGPSIAAALQFPRAQHCYDYRQVDRSGALDKKINAWLKACGHCFKANDLKLQKFVEKVESAGENLSGLDDDALRRQFRQWKNNIDRKQAYQQYLVTSFAYTREFSYRKLQMRHYPAQLKGGWVLAQGMVAEMDTGQGKTLTATLAASAVALLGIPTHVITVNDYLAERDARQMRPLYEALGIQVGVVMEGMSDEEKRRAYACDVTYCTNKTVAFDHLRDRMVMGNRVSELHLQIDKVFKAGERTSQLLLRGLGFAIVDEADSVFIDEAITPLIISAQRTNDNKRRIYEKALQYSTSLEQEQHYIINKANRNILLTNQGEQQLSALGNKLGGLWKNKIARNELIVQALKARYFFERDKDYIIEDGAIKIVDAFTGRVMKDRSWEGGLHQMIEVKENLEMTQDRSTLARISYQRFFKRYLNLAGMTGTAREVRKELNEVYQLHVQRIPPQQVPKRVHKPDVYCKTLNEKWEVIGEKVKVIHATGQPVLIGTRSVEDSEELSARLQKLGLKHSLLNARQDHDEALIIEAAGEVGNITVATNMAGRGTDIKLSPESIALGGLYVIASERHESRRVDRQLYGRCGRQGDPGVSETVVSLEDEILQNAPGALLALSRSTFRNQSQHSTKASSLLAKLFETAQKNTEQKQFHARAQVKRMDEHFGNLLAFTGIPE